MSTRTRRVSCQKGPTRHSYAWQIGPFWQDILELLNEHTYPVPTPSYVMAQQVRDDKSLDDFDVLIINEKPWHHVIQLFWNGHICIYPFRKWYILRHQQHSKCIQVFIYWYKYRWYPNELFHILRDDPVCRGLELGQHCEPTCNGERSAHCNLGILSFKSHCLSMIHYTLRTADVTQKGRGNYTKSRGTLSVKNYILNCTTCQLFPVNR